MKDYSYLQAIYMSFYSRKLYRDVANNWGGGVVLYLFILLAICWAVMVFRYQPVIDRSFRQVADQVTPQVPEVKIQKGQASTPENRPYLIKDLDNGDVVAIIDTSDKYQSLNDTPSSTRILLTKDAVFYMDGSNNIRMQKIPNTLMLNVKPEIVKIKLLQFVGWSWLIIFPFLLFFSFIYRLAQSLVYAAIGKVFSALSNIPLTYAKILKISMIAVTPAIILSTILDWLYVGFSFELLAFFVITMVYLFFGIKANKDN